MPRPRKRHWYVVSVIYKEIPAAKVFQCKRYESEEELSAALETHWGSGEDYFVIEGGVQVEPTRRWVIDSPEPRKPTAETPPKRRGRPPKVKTENGVETERSERPVE